MFREKPVQSSDRGTASDARSDRGPPDCGLAWTLAHGYPARMNSDSPIAQIAVHNLGSSGGSVLTRGRTSPLFRDTSGAGAGRLVGVGVVQGRVFVRLPVVFVVEGGQCAGDEHEPTRSAHLRSGSSEVCSTSSRSRGMAAPVSCAPVLR